MSLSLGVNSKEVTYDGLKDFKVTDRNHVWIGKQGKTYSLNRSDKWEGLQHYDFASKIVGCCEAFNMPVNMDKSRWGVSDEGSDLFASVTFLPSKQGKMSTLFNYFSEDTMPTLGIRHSNRGRFSAQMTIGASVLVCDNLVITGQYLFKKKHTSANANDLGFTIRQGLLEFISGQEDVLSMVDGLKNTYLSDESVGKMYLNMARDKALPWSHLGKVDKYWHQPTHVDFTRRGLTGWRMYNAINTVAKEYNPTRQIELVTKARKFITDSAEKEETICF